MNVSVAILRLKDGLDYSGIIADIDDLILNKAPTKRPMKILQFQVLNVLLSAVPLIN